MHGAESAAGQSQPASVQSSAPPLVCATDRCASSAWIVAELAPVLAIAMAVLDGNGVLLETNSGFMRLIEAEGAPRPGISVAHFFLQPTFAVLSSTAAGPDGEIYRGLLTIGDCAGKTRTLRARIWRTGAALRVLAEFDVEELERLYDSVLELNRDYAGAQAALAQANLRLQQREAEIVAVSLTDALTGVGNRRRLEQALTLEVSRVKRSGTRLCAVMADLDFFKRINDGYGHEAGDRVLASFGALLQAQTRPTDIVARFGGEEFVILMPDSDLANALAAAQRIRATLAAARIEPLPAEVTASFGVAELGAGEQGDALLRRIDGALYAAKQAGRNRVEAA